MSEFKPPATKISEIKPVNDRPVTSPVVADKARTQSIVSVQASPQQQHDLEDEHQSRIQLIETRNVARDAVVDFFRSATFNGQAISIQGSNIQVNVPATIPFDPFNVATRIAAPAPIVTLPPPQAVVTPPIQPLPPAPVSVVKPVAHQTIAAPTIQTPTQVALPQTQPQRPQQSPLGSSTSTAYARTTQTGERVNVQPLQPISRPALSQLGSGISHPITPKFVGLSKAYGQRSAVYQKKPSDHKSHTNFAVHKHGKVSGDPTDQGTTLIPVRFVRADGEKTIVAYLNAPTGYIVEGAVEGERTLPLPDPDLYYDAGGSGTSRRGFILYGVLSGGSVVIRCHAYSYLYKGEMDGTTWSITDLTSDFSPEIGDQAWLEITQDGAATISAVELKIDAPWGTNPALVDLNVTDPANPYIEKAYYPLAKFVDPTSDESGTIVQLGDPEAPTPIKIVQWATGNLLAVLRSVNGAVGWTCENFGGGL